MPFNRLYVYMALSFLLAKLYLNQVYAAPTEGFTTVFTKVQKPSEWGEKQSGCCSCNILPWPTPATDPHAKSSTSIFDTPQHFSKPQEPHPLSVPHHGLLSTGDVYPRAENPLNAGFASPLHGDENSRAFGDHDHHPLRGKNGDLASYSSIHRNDSPLPSMEPQVGEAGQVKFSSQRKRKSQSDIPGSSAQPGMMDDSQLTEVPQDANILSSPQRKNKFRSKIQQTSAQPGIMYQSQPKVAQHPEGAVETRHKLHGNGSDSDQDDSDQERAPAAPGPSHTTKAQLKKEQDSERSRRHYLRNMKEVDQILDFTDRTLDLKTYTTFSHKIMGRIEARVNGQLISSETSQRPRVTAESVKKNVENITKISTYLILRDISMLRMDNEEMIMDKKEVERVLLFMDNFWEKIFAGTLKLPGKFTWIPRLAVRLDPCQYRRLSPTHRRGGYFWLITSKEIEAVWLASGGIVSP